MAEAGLVYANLAIEHGDEYMRNKIIGKALDRKKIFEVAALFKKYKVMGIGLYIMGFPEDTNETLQKTYDMRFPEVPHREKPIIRSSWDLSIY